MEAKGTQGFDPKSGRMLGEVAIAAVVIVGLGVLAYIGAGWLASQATPLVSMEVDRSIGRAASAQLSLGQTACSGPEVAYVKQLAQPLLDAAGPLPFEFQFSVVDDPTVNAFALPGGYVTVNRGLLEKAESGEEIAGVLGHEIQHALLRHGTRRMLREMSGSLVLGLLVGSGDVGQAMAVGGQLTSLSYGRDEESEADLRGVELLVKAGIDPGGLVKFFERLAVDAVAVPELLSTHPDSGRRAELVASARKGAEFRPLPPPPRPACTIR